MTKTKTAIGHLHLIVLSSAALIVVTTLFAFSGKSSQASPDKLDWKKEVSPKSCDRTGSPVINVTQKVANSVDSGEAGNNWAFDNYNRKIQVWKQTGNTWCALVDYQGKFDSQDGQTSPGNTGTLTGNEDGNFKGGYRAIITGALKTTSGLATKGSIGTVDYQCDLAGNCPGAFNWMDKYFVTSSPGFSSNLDWWGWEYKYKNKVWINSSDGNSGDVL